VTQLKSGRAMKLPFVGGPFDGEECEVSAASVYLVPDSQDVSHYVREDGTVGTLFGEHRYERKYYAIGSRVAEWFQHVGYRKPERRS